MNGNDKPILAICYDFDKTLSPTDMQNQGFIQQLGIDIDDFWAESNGMAEENDMDQNLAYMYMMATRSRGKLIVKKENLEKAGADLKLFPGVDTWFDRIDTYGKQKDVAVEHYIISSGLKEMIEGTIIASKFKRIYASSFFYDDAGVAVWPAQVVNYTGKTQYLFRIEKGVFDVNDQRVNTFFGEDEYRVPFRNMVYIGDSDTDIPCMKLVNKNGGHSIGVYNPDTNDKTKVYKMLSEQRIKFFMPADYTESSQLEVLIKEIIDRTYHNERLERQYYSCLREKDEDMKTKTVEEIKKESLILELEESSSFKNTHSIVGRLKEYNDWSEEQKNKLKSIALSNNQVKYIIGDMDLRDFYSMIVSKSDKASEQIKEEIDKYDIRRKK